MDKEIERLKSLLVENGVKEKEASKIVSFHTDTLSGSMDLVIGFNGGRCVTVSSDKVYYYPPDWKKPKLAKRLKHLADCDKGMLKFLIKEAFLIQNIQYSLERERDFIDHNDVLEAEAHLHRVREAYAENK